MYRGNLKCIGCDKSCCQHIYGEGQLKVNCDIALIAQFSYAGCGGVLHFFLGTN